LIAHRSGKEDIRLWFGKQANLSHRSFSSRTKISFSIVICVALQIIGAVEVEVDSRIPQISLSDDIVISLSPVALNMMSTVLKTFIVPKAGIHYNPHLTEGRI